MKTITVQQATVRTAAVEIRTLSVGGKQVTMGLFRQLLREDLIDPHTCQFRGAPWGLVNYFWGDCHPESHLHIVWQLGNELRRSCVWPAVRHNAEARRLLEHWANIQSCLSETAILSLALETCPRHVRKEHKGYPEGSPYRTDHHLEIGTWTVGRDSDLERTLGLLWGFSTYGVVREDASLVLKEVSGVQERIASLVGQLAEWGVPLPTYPEPECRRLWHEYKNKPKTLEEGWRTRYAELASLDQLFIAV
jgi:hypothetical protein